MRTCGCHIPLHFSLNPSPPVVIAIERIGAVAAAAFSVRVEPVIVAGVIARVEVKHRVTLFDMDAKQLLVEALRLSDEERAALAGELIQSLEREVDSDAEAAWSAEIRARLERMDAGTARTIPWAEARRRIHAAAGRGPRT